MWIRSSMLLFIWLLSFTGQSVLATDFFTIEGGELDVGFGYRTDKLDWNIASNPTSGTQNILSELNWDNLEIIQIQLSGRLELGELPLLDSNTIMLVNAAAGTIFAGDYQDSDYGMDNRGDEWSRSIGDSESGFTADLLGGIGPILKFNKLLGFSVTPLVGYGFNMQDLSMTSGVQVVSIPALKPVGLMNDPPANGSINGLDSTYTAYWYGPWIGLNGECQITEKFKLSTGVEFHWIEYYAQADWNLRTDFEHPVSFEHETTGTGIVFNIKGSYVINEKWSWLISGNYHDWETESGTARFFMKDSTVSKTRLNGVNWKSLALNFGVGYCF